MHTHSLRWVFTATLVLQFAMRCIFCRFVPSETVFILCCLSISTKYKICCFLKILEMSVLSNVCCNKWSSLLSPTKDPSDICSVPAFRREEREVKERQREKIGVDCQLSYRSYSRTWLLLRWMTVCE